MFTSTLVLAASNDGGQAVGGFLLMIGLIWFVAYLCTPKKKGWDIDHQGKTTIKPRN